MKTSIIILGLSLSVLVGSSEIQAQQGIQPDRSAITAKQKITKRVGFRLTQWQTIHDDGSEVMKDTIQTLKKIGCEVKKEEHGNHSDIAFRCSIWKSIDVRDDKSAHEWMKWMTSNKFEAVLLHPEKNIVLPKIRIRLSDWKTVHPRDLQETQSFMQTLKVLGCETKLENHGNHSDLKYRCQKWITIAFPDSQAAHRWEPWLKKTGFQTEHKHEAGGKNKHSGHKHDGGNHDGHDHN